MHTFLIWGQLTRHYMPKEITILLRKHTLLYCDICLTHQGSLSYTCVDSESNDWVIGFFHEKYSVRTNVSWTTKKGKTETIIVMVTCILFGCPSLCGKTMDKVNQEKRVLNKSLWIKSCSSFLLLNYLLELSIDGSCFLVIN